MCSVLGLVSEAERSEAGVGVGHSLRGALEQERKPVHGKQTNEKRSRESERNLVFWLPARDLPRAQGDTYPWQHFFITVTNPPFLRLKRTLPGSSQL